MAYHRASDRLLALLESRPCDEPVPAGRVIMTLLFKSAIYFVELPIIWRSDAINLAIGSIRGLYEIVVTAKYLANHPAKASLFERYDVINSEHLYQAIHRSYGISFSHQTEDSLNSEENTCESAVNCEVGGQSWTLPELREMAEQVALGDLYLDCYALPRKLLGATMLGARYVSPYPQGMVEVTLYNTVRAAHLLLIDAIFLFHNHLGHLINAITDIPPIEDSLQAAKDWSDIWEVSESNA
jgi:hypothetical protein